LNRPVRISWLAALDLQQARDWFDRREDGLGNKFLSSVEQALARVPPTLSSTWYGRFYVVFGH
jgi:hypothetical protein